MADEAARREGMTKISDLTKQASELIKQATTVANETGNSFSFSLGERSMTYEPVESDNWRSSDCFGEYSVGWKSSSDYC